MQYILHNFQWFVMTVGNAHQIMYLNEFGWRNRSYVFIKMYFRLTELSFFLIMNFYVDRFIFLLRDAFLC